VIRLPHFNVAARRLQRVFPLSLTLLAAACLAGGGWWLWRHATDASASAFRAPAGLILIALGLLQARILIRAWQSGALARTNLPGQPLFWRWLLAGPIGCYAAALWLGSPAGAYFFVAALALWYTVAVLPLALDAQWRRSCAGWLHRPAIGTIGWSAFAALGLLAALELTVRTYGWFTGGHLPGAYLARDRALPPGLEFRGGRVNAQGYWGNDFTAARRPGVFRIAAVGDGMLLTGDARTNYLAEVERRVPGIEIYNFGIPSVGPREYAAQLAREVLTYQPDMVLTFISIGDDIAQPTPAPGTFDWRGLGLFQLGACAWGASASEVTLPPDSRSSPDRDHFLRATAGRLAVCRTPMDQAMRDRWQETMSHLDQIVRQCQGQGISMAIVLVPGEFQVSATLCESLRRNAGLERGQLDLDLPQRRLVEFADQRQVPVLDLLPHFRATSEYPYERNDVGFNDAGNAIAADVVGGWLQHRYSSQLAAMSQVSP
jgi:hypothetical protein